MPLTPCSTIPWCKEFTYRLLHPPELPTESSLWSSLYFTIAAYSGLSITVSLTVFSLHVPHLLTKSSVLVCLDCRNKIPQSRCLEQQNWFSHSTGGWKSKILATIRVGFCWDVSSGLKTAAFSVCPHRAAVYALCVQREGDGGGERGWERVRRGLRLLSLPLVRALVLSEEGPFLKSSFNLHYLLKYRHSGGEGFSAWIWWGHNSVLNTLCWVSFSCVPGEGMSGCVQCPFMGPPVLTVTVSFSSGGPHHIFWTCFISPLVCSLLWS